MLKTDPPEVSVPFYSNYISEDAWVGHGGQDGGDTCLNTQSIEMCRIFAWIQKYVYKDHFTIKLMSGLGSCISRDFAVLQTFWS